jgi:hypothetical protein
MTRKELKNIKIENLTWIGFLNILKHITKTGKNYPRMLKFIHSGLEDII